MNQIHQCQFIVWRYYFFFFGQEIKYLTASVCRVTNCFATGPQLSYSWTPVAARRRPRRVQSDFDFINGAICSSSSSHQSMTNISYFLCPWHPINMAHKTLVWSLNMLGKEHEMRDEISLLIIFPIYPTGKVHGKVNRQYRRFLGCRYLTDSLPESLWCSHRSGKQANSV